MQRRKNYGIYFSIMVSFSVVVAGALYFAYGVLPRQYYLPIGLGVVVVAGALVYFILSRVVDI